MKTDKIIHGRTVRKTEQRGLWDLMEQRCGKLTGRVIFTGTLREIRRGLSEVERTHRVR